MVYAIWSAETIPPHKFCVGRVVEPTKLIMRIGIIAALVVVLHGAADAGRGGRGFGGGHVIVRGGGGGGRVVVHHTQVLQPVHNRLVVVPNQPAVVRYYDYNRPPAPHVESYGYRPGYYWVPGSWQWNASEWIWYPGHYEPDPNYVPAVHTYVRY